MEPFSSAARNNGASRPPQPVTAFHPGPAEKTELLPVVTSWNGDAGPGFEEKYPAIR